MSMEPETCPGCGRHNYCACKSTQTEPPPHRRSDPAAERIGDWKQTFTGRKFWPRDPRPEEIYIEDIAHSLSLQCRYTGHVRRFYSVAEHSLRVSEWVTGCGREMALWGLLHDAAEAYLGDMSAPLKHGSRLGDEYKKLERPLQRMICEKYGLSPEKPPDVREADKILLCWEKRDLMGPGPELWVQETPGRLRVLPKEIIIPLSSDTAERTFLNRFKGLTRLPVNLPGYSLTPLTPAAIALSRAAT